MQDINNTTNIKHFVLLNRLDTLEKEYKESIFRFNELSNEINSFETNYMQSIQEIENQRNQEHQVIGDNFVTLSKYADGIRKYLEEQEKALAKNNTALADEFISILNAVQYDINEIQLRISNLESKYKQL
ncbi:hypothetical protein [Parasitella parasitica]|uniref:Uncharacterized protein n=1 Tax=Parasitella parasitica TaxID=35722 RepID=A0A0B7NHC6_9FUNG|nr:hypothetical protein [Parasitella parasitica]